VSALLFPSVDIVMCNRIHIETARFALASAAWARGETPAYGEDAVSDLLADIRHFCTATGLDFARCSRVAGMYFRDENGGAP
jgi:hypothetical protein